MIPKHCQPLTRPLAWLCVAGCIAGCATYQAGDRSGSNAGAGGTGVAGSDASGGVPTTAGVAGAPPTAGAPSGGAAGLAGGAGQSAAAGASVGGSVSDGGAASAGSGGTDAAAGGGGAGSQGMPPANALETLAVPATGASVVSKTSLDNGELFLLKATGSVSAGVDQFDAEYGGFGAGAAGQDSVSGADVGLDIGFKVERTPTGTVAGRKKWFGSYRPDHTYYLIVTGVGMPMSIKLVLPAGSAGTGALTVSILRLSPAAPALAPALDTIMANVTKPTVRSTLSTKASVVYLLQATGSGKVGGNNLGLGDADWMDWAADGTGKVDIGDQNVDYGLGVDESDPTVTPRQRWWGPWRKDHSYFMLFSGTGNSIGFSYYDVGNYGDNSATDKISVHVFPVP